MILVRDVFRLRFGEAREAINVWKEGREIAVQIDGNAAQWRLMTDLTGPYYTLVLESTYPDLSTYERTGKMLMGDKRWQAWYRRFVPLAESGYRELFTLVE